MIKYRRLRWADHVSRLEAGRSAIKMLTGKPMGKRSLGRPRCLSEVLCGSEKKLAQVYWIWGDYFEGDNIDID